LNQGDGMHPNAAGVDAIVARILPRVEELVTRARAARAS
jgi:acyl-CoA thioesterase I